MQPHRHRQPIIGFRPLGWSQETKTPPATWRGRVSVVEGRSNLWCSSKRRSNRSRRNRSSNNGRHSYETPVRGVAKI